MRKLPSAVDPKSEAFAANARVNRALVEDLRARTAVAGLGGPEDSRKRHVSRGKLLPRDRVMRLLDPGSPFLRWASLPPAGSTTTRRRAPA